MVAVHFVTMFLHMSYALLSLSSLISLSIPSLSALAHYFSPTNFAKLPAQFYPRSYLITFSRHLIGTFNSQALLPRKGRIFVVVVVIVKLIIGDSRTN